ncbi:hypothetical protein L3Q82_011349 [Scortum barcoo]|uniref:Uncharacterized protein n=1 Tax=Scortum barcoo TaxID=214431 RepID=A0ACB8W9Q8_9TELE|nr:hypothetical protein L3Q82_011349 [Scortum barcoo]
MEGETENMKSSKNDNMEDDVSMENVFNDEQVSQYNINASKRKKSADKGQGGGKTRKTLQSLSDEEEEAELTVSQEERITSYSVEKISGGFYGFHIERRRPSPCSHQYRSGGTLEKPSQSNSCQQYNHNVTKQITLDPFRTLETEVQHLLSCTGDQGHIEALKSKKAAAIANLLGITAQGALVRSRFMNASMLDSPSKFFFSLESRNGQRKVIHCLRSDNGSSLTETTEIRRYATRFYRDLFKTELVEDPELDSTFLSGLPQVGDSSDSLLSADLTLDELHVALMSLANGKAPGIDGIPVEFYKAFWPVVGEDMLEVFQESLRSGFLPQSCRRAVITLLPKKGDLQDPEELETGLFALLGLQGPVEGSGFEAQRSDG